jgi:hypothetical protein
MPDIDCTRSSVRHCLPAALSVRLERCFVYTAAKRPEMYLYHTACGAESSKKSLLARYNGNATVSKFMEAVDEGARTEEQLELFDICPQTGICFLKAEIALCCIHRLRLRGYAVVLQPLIPDFGYGYAVNRDRWLAKPSVRKASHGRLALLHGVRIFKTGRDAKLYHAKLLEA